MATLLMLPRFMPDMGEGAVFAENDENIKRFEEYADMILIWVMLWIVGRGQVQEIAHITVWEIYAKEGGGGCRILCIESCKDKKENVVQRMYLLKTWIYP